MSTTLSTSTGAALRRTLSMTAARGPSATLHLAGFEGVPRLLKVRILAALLAGTAGLCSAETMNRAEFVAHRHQIEADYKGERTLCDRLDGNDKDLCVQKARGRERIALAELDYNLTGSERNASRLALAEAEATYAVARDLCDAKSGEAKNRCMKDADAAHETAQERAHERALGGLRDPKF